jgi:molybdopterin biosynthesis enzyme MoaB
LSRAVAGVRSRSIIINLPGSVSGVEQCIDVIFESVLHAVQIVNDDTEH